MSVLIDSDMRRKLADAEKSLNEGKEQLVTDKYSKLVITTSYPEEGRDITAFLANLEEYAGKHLNGSYYLVGSSAMNYEMQETFDDEFSFITLLTVAAIFLIVALTFKSISITYESLCRLHSYHNDFRFNLGHDYRSCRRNVCILPGVLAVCDNLCTYLLCLITKSYTNTGGGQYFQPDPLYPPIRITSFNNHITPFTHSMIYSFPSVAF